MKASRALLVAVLLCACQKGSGLVRIELEAETGLVLDDVEVSVTSQRDGSGSLNHQVIAWAPPAGGPLAVGLYLPSSVSGLVWAHASGRRGGQPVAGAEPQSVSVSPGAASAPVHLRLTAGPAATDGGLPPGDAGPPPADGGNNDGSAGFTANSTTFTLILSKNGGTLIRVYTKQP